MEYRLRHFENNWQIISSLGYLLIVLGIVNFFISPWAVGVVFLALGIFCVWFQLRGKRITVDTKDKTVKRGRDVIQLSNPTAIIMKEVRLSQNVNSRASTTTVKSYFYKAFIQDGDKSILISCNGNDKRDVETLNRIAEDLSIPFIRKYN
ncbi:MAG: hypothetical protein HRT61_09230 [Ekhidna sp.]|nr:hypothetical protein [Ekhidna sp.]